jgi:restriction endonuclease S subunit
MTKILNTWELKAIGDFCKTSSGGTPLKSKKEYYDDGTIPWLQSGEVNQREITISRNFITKKGVENSSAKVFPPNTVLVAMYGATAGQVGILRFESTTNQAVCGIFPNAKLIPEYLYYCLLEGKSKLIAQAAGNAQPNISQEKIKNTRIPLPPITEQTRIVTILDEAFTALDQAKANLERNLQNAKELFQSELNRVFTEQGGGWVERKLGEVCETISDGDHAPPPKAETGVPFITISNIDKENNSIDFTSTFKVPQEYFNEIKASRRPAKNDVLYTVTGSFGIPVLVDFDFEFCFQRHIGLLRPNDLIFPKFLYYWIKSPTSQALAQEAATGTAQRTVSLGALRNFVIIHPGLVAQKRIVERLNSFEDSVFKIQAAQKAKLAHLSTLKQSLLEQAFAGKL